MCIVYIVAKLAISCISFYLSYFAAILLTHNHIYVSSPMLGSTTDTQHLLSFGCPIKSSNLRCFKAASYFSHSSVGKLTRTSRPTHGIFRQPSIVLAGGMSLISFILKGKHDLRGSFPPALPELQRSKYTTQMPVMDDHEHEAKPPTPELKSGAVKDLAEIYLLPPKQEKLTKAFLSRHPLSFIIGEISSHTRHSKYEPWTISTLVLEEHCHVFCLSW